MLSRRAFLAGSAGLAALPTLTTLAACGTSGTTFERMRAAGVARIGIAGERPYGYLNGDGAVTGEAPTVARAVLADLGVGGVEAVQVPFARLLTGLLDGQYDLVAAGTTITPSRCARVAFSRPDFLAPLAFLVPEGNPQGLRTLGGASRSRTRLGVLEGSAEQDYALAAGVSPTAITTYDGQSTLYRAVANGEVPAAVLTRLSLLDEQSRNPGSRLQVTPGFAPSTTPTGEPVYPVGAFAFRPADTDLVVAFDTALTDLQTSGRWLETVRPFGFDDENLPQAGLTTAQLCTS
ncbi:transporter substrate-binding domain-containing protein [Pseudonocardia oroxyli]|uniref:Amino acid ABC transporter substrate-binding protein, PAAT family n=1 Tax=Pseudonocardia oroxyli TaxID=366584 RepID=A0A1G7N5J0_PSEOR|nr:transporter substrate-binding domain-containing protein [Pseudonocardia oroxyli]SDF69211.1 amino acid ABC transporter substrate-binding protein, PAAT family [Pseudonocardia oroxyli]